MRPRPTFTVLVVTPEDVPRVELARVLEAGARALGRRLAVQARSKGSAAARARIVQDAHDIARALEIPLFVNGDPEAASRLRAHLHVPGALSREGLRARFDDRWLSCPAHDDTDVGVAAEAGFDAVLVSPIADVPGKGPARGVGAIARARTLAPDLHVVALGGIDGASAEACFSAGADAIAVMRAPFVDTGLFARVAALGPRRA